MPKRPVIVCLLAILIGACQEDAPHRLLPTAPAAVVPAPQAAAIASRLLERGQTRALLVAYMRTHPGESDLIERQIRRMDSTDQAYTPSALLTSTTTTETSVTDDPATWPKAQIVDPTVLASLDPSHSFAYAGMYHNGHYGLIDLKYTLADSKGITLQSYDHTNSDFNLWGRLRFSLATQSVQIFTSVRCGAALRASAQFTAYYVVNPIDIPLGSFGSIPATAAGRTDIGGSNMAEQGPCASPDAGGSNGGGGTNVTYVHLECWYTDWYDGDGNYMYTTFDGCTSTVMEA